MRETITYNGNKIKRVGISKYIRGSVDEERLMEK